MLSFGFNGLDLILEDLNYINPRSQDLNAPSSAKLFPENLHHLMLTSYAANPKSRMHAGYAGFIFL